MGAHPGRDSAFAVIRRGSRVLIVRTRSGRWQLPGGRLEHGEKHWDAVRREVKEETGMRVSVLGLTGIYGRRGGSRAVVFAARVPRRARTAGPRNEIREQRWVQPARADRLLKKSARRRLHDALASRGAYEVEPDRVAQWRAAIR